MSVEVDSSLYGAPRHSRHRAPGFPFKSVLGVIAGFFIPGRVDLVISGAEIVAPIAADKGNEKIDELRHTSAFGGERQGETAADEIIYSNPDQ